MKAKAAKRLEFVRWAIVVAIGVMPAIGLAEDLLPKQPDFSRYQTLLNHSFAIAAGVPMATSDSVKDLYVESIGWTDNDCVVTLTLRSATDKNLKKKVPGKCTLPVKRPNERDFGNIYIDLRP